MPDQLPKKLKQARRRELKALEAELRDAYFESLRGMTLRVLAESPLEDRPGLMVGTSCRYTPTIAEASGPGDFVEVTDGSVSEGTISGLV